MSVLQEIEKHGLADCEFNRKLFNYVYVVRAYNQFGEWMDDVGYFETKELAEKCLLQSIEGDDYADPWHYHIEDYSKEI